jgi:predicted nucleic acid-binding protein
VFWDSSALVPYLVSESMSGEITALLGGDTTAMIWWATPVECLSALERRKREGRLDSESYEEARSKLSKLLDECAVVQPHALLRTRAEHLLVPYPLRAADALQLAAALVACEESPQGEIFLSFDVRLREAAAKEGFQVLPESPRV